MSKLNDRTTEGATSTPAGQHPQAGTVRRQEQTSRTFISSEWNKSASSGLSIKIFGLSPSFGLMAPPELSPRDALCP